MDKEQVYRADFPAISIVLPEGFSPERSSSTGDGASIFATDSQAINLEKSAIIIEKLKSRFVQVAGTMSESLWDALETINNDPRLAITQIHHIAHSLAGNAETFGFPVLGQAAYDLSEVILCQEKFANDNMDVREIASLSNHLLEMLRDVSATIAH